MRQLFSALTAAFTFSNLACATPTESPWVNVDDLAPAPVPTPTPSPAEPSAPIGKTTPHLTPPAPLPDRSAGSRNLRDAFAAAVKNGETMDIQRELLVQSGESYRQALDAFSPTVSAAWNYTHQQTPTSNAAPNFLNDQRTSKLTASMPLFRGLRDFAALRQRKYQREAQRFAMQAASKQLFVDVAAAFYNLLALQSDEKNYQVEIEINRKRLSDLQTFLRIGRTRPTDLLSLQANVSSLEAQLESIRGQLENAKDVLAYLTNWDRSTAIVDDEGVFSPDTIEKCLEAVEQRADVRAALTTAKATSENIPIARGGHYPSLDLLGDAFFQRPGQPDGGPDWDVQLALTIPIYQGGIVSSQVRQAQSVAHQYELQLSQARRSAGEEIRTLFNSYSADQKQVAKLESTVDWAKKNYLSQLGDYKNGLVTNLDVLTATSNFQSAVRTLDRQRLTLKLDGIKLQAAIAQRSELGSVAD